MEANEISLDIVYEKRDENGKLEYEGVSFAKGEFPLFLKETVSPVYKDEEYSAQMKEVAIDMTGFDSANLQAVFNIMPKVSNFRIGELVAEKIVESRYKAKFRRHFHLHHNRCNHKYHLHLLLLCSMSYRFRYKLPLQSCIFHGQGQAFPKAL